MGDGAALGLGETACRGEQPGAGPAGVRCASSRRPPVRRLPPLLVALAEHRLRHGLAAKLAARPAAGHGELHAGALVARHHGLGSPLPHRQRSLSRVQPGDILLMHPTAETVQGLPEMIAGIRRMGLES